MTRRMLTENEKTRFAIRFNVDGLLRGDYESRMKGYAIGRQNCWMSANDIRVFENLAKIPTNQRGDLYLVNGNMLPIMMAGTEMYMSSVSMLMIHNLMTIADGNKDKMQKAIETLNEVKESIINTCEIKIGLSRIKLSHLMDANKVAVFAPVLRQASSNCVDICQRNGIERLNNTGDTIGNLAKYCWFSNTNCPGPYLGSKFSYITDEVNRR